MQLNSRLLPLLSCVLLVSLFSTAQDNGRRSELEESLQSRYRLTVLGGGVLGIHGGENSVRRAGGIAVVLKPGLYASYDRSRLVSNAIRGGEAHRLSAPQPDDAAVEAGERFYVTSVHVGSDVVTVGLLSVRMVPGQARSGQLWCSLNFFFDKQVLADGDINKVYAAMDPWLTPADTISAGSALTPASGSQPPAGAASAPVAERAALELKPGMDRQSVISLLGNPPREVTFGDHRWLEYPALVVSMEQGKLTSVSSSSAPSTIKITAEPAGGEVFVDGSFVGSSGTTLQLQPGSHTITVKLAGYQDWQRVVQAMPGAEQMINAVLTK